MRYYPSTTFLGPCLGPCLGPGLGSPTGLRSVCLYKYITWDSWPHICSVSLGLRVARQLFLLVANDPNSLDVCHSRNVTDVELLSPSLPRCHCSGCFPSFLVHRWSCYVEVNRIHTNISIGKFSVVSITIREKPYQRMYS